MNSGLRENVFLIIDMKINFFMAIAMLVVSVAVVVGVKAYNYYSLSPLMKANLEALSQDDEKPQSPVVLHCKIVEDPISVCIAPCPKVPVSSYR